MTESFAQFTEHGYRELLDAVKRRYRFASFPEALGPVAGTPPPVLWRHDVDVSVHRALALARIENGLGVKATYFFLFHSEFYNLLEGSVARRVKEILSLGHRPGLHFDLGYYGPMAGAADLERRISQEATMFEQFFGVAPEAVSFHNPEEGNALQYDADRLAGLVNTYAGTLRSGFEYVSDSNGYWRFKNLMQVAAEGGGPLHVLTHPEWYVESAMSPRERISRAIDGRAREIHRWYDAALKSMGRNNVR
jgi:hypothetical protein